MTLAKPDRLSELIDPDRRWDNWRMFLREHPTYLREVIERLPAATNHEQAIHKTRMIGWWMNDQGDQMCRAVSMEKPAECNYLVGVHFADNPYGPAKGTASLGMSHVDPYLVEHPITWDMVDMERLRNEQGNVLDFNRIINAPVSDGAHPWWVDRMHHAEREWFAQSLDAPVIVVQWRCDKPSAGVLDQVEMDLWDATAAVLSMTGTERRQVNGYRRLAREYPPKLGKPRHPMARHSGQPYSLDMRIHAPSRALMAYRQAVLIDQGTVERNVPISPQRRL